MEESRARVMCMYLSGEVKRQQHPLCAVSISGWMVALEINIIDFDVFCSYIWLAFVHSIRCWRKKKSVIAFAAEHPKQFSTLIRKQFVAREFVILFE